MERVKNRLSLLIKFEGAVLLYSICLPFLLISFHLYLWKSWVFSSVQVLLLFLSLISGVLVGVEFPLANKIYLKDINEVGFVASRLYTADLIGACLGALIVSVVMVPVLGILSTGIFIITINLTSFILVISSKNI